jgi:hypothetical protein
MSRQRKSTSPTFKINMNLLQIYSVNDTTDSHSCFEFGIIKKPFLFLVLVVSVFTLFMQHFLNVLNYFPFLSQLSLETFKFHYNCNHHRPLIPLSGVGTTCHIPFTSITRHLHAHSFYSHVILHKVHPSFLRATSARCPCTLI